jgi:Fe-S-cluster containining protein
MSIIPFEQFVPSNVCLQCDGCCRFKEPGTIWRPKLTDEETDVIKRSELADMIFSPDVLDGDQFIKTKPGCGEHLCRFFNPDNHACAIYDSRPFECALYPYVLSCTDKGIGLYMHLNCPYVEEHYQKETMKNYQAYLQVFFRRDDVVSFLKRNVRFLNDYAFYQQELELVFFIEGI